MTCGLNNWGQLGQGTRYEGFGMAGEVACLRGKTVVQAALLQHATVVLTADGKLWSCGRNSYGQLGRPTEEEFALQFGEVPLPDGVRMQQIAAGNHHVLAVDEEGRLYSWGFGEYQQLGNGKYQDETRVYHVASRLLAVGKRRRTTCRTAA